MNCKGHAGTNDAIYGLGFVGAVIYFVQHANSFGMGLFGVLKAVVWPALVTYNLLGFLNIK